LSHLLPQKRKEIRAKAKDPAASPCTNATVIEDGRLGPGLAGIKCVDGRNNKDGEERKGITGVQSEFIHEKY
jgi:hypothetical protein